MCLPIGFSFGQNARAAASFTIATLGAPTRSATVNWRPRLSGTCSVENHFVETHSRRILGIMLTSTFGRSSRPKSEEEQPPVSGAQLPRATSVTPGTAPVSYTHLRAHETG